jgi:hypothetical protein
MNLINSLLILVTFGLQLSIAQDVRQEKPQPQQKVKEFFGYFHDRDTTKLRQMMLDHPLYSIINRQGVKVSTSTVDEFLAGMARIPTDFEFKEEIVEYKVHTDGSMAVVTTPYKFYLNEELSHTGTNVFVMFWLEDKWMISGITDSRIYE